MRRSEALAVLGSVAVTQWGMVTTPQAEAVGVSRVHLTRMTQAALLERMLHGVYRIADSERQVFDAVRAAWLSTDPQRTAVARIDSDDPGAVAIGLTAAHLHGLTDEPPGVFEFATRHRNQSRRSRSYRCRVRHVGAGDTVLRAGIPTTRRELTLLDAPGVP